MRNWTKAAATAVSAALTALAVSAPLPQQTTVSAVSSGTSISDMPSEYQYAADWIWNNRIMKEDSMGVNSKRWNILFDQIIRNKGQLNYVVRWQSTQTITYAERKAFETLVDEGINQWTDWLVGYENWPYDHVQVNIIGWACIDKSSLLDLHDDETVWTDTEYDSLSETQSGVPSKLPVAPSSMWTFEHFQDPYYNYPSVTFDEYLWCTQNYGDYGGCGGDWGQRLSDNYYKAAANGTGYPHIYWHELGHGFGMTDFYGGEGESDGFPPGGFPGGENSIMMAGSCSYVNDFDGWMLRYMWSKVCNDTSRFDLANAVTSSTTMTTTTATSTSTTTTTTATSTATTPITTSGPDGDGVYHSAYDSENQCWYVSTGGASKIRLAASGVPWAGVSGAYGYWDNNQQAWVQKDFIYSDSLGATGTAEIEIDFGAANVTDTLQIQVWYYAAWDNSASDMLAQDPSTLSFTVYTDETAVSSATTTTTTRTTATTFVTTLPGQSVVWGDANCNGECQLEDAVLLAKSVASVSELSVQGKVNCDVYADGKTDGSDLNIVLKLIAGSAKQSDMPVNP